ncbi:hypothetical protein [Paenibacillus campi]|uniref:hypothetical protein n=1 Tax=Paenibacillus campi TaxID=3106031 RepID=UPI002B003D01|nr:hypothetical protein [Paenibacillus sp. SGZ-1014]
MHNAVNGYTIGLSVPIEHVSYVWGWGSMIGDRNVTALELCTGDLDRLDTTIQCNRVSFISSNSTCQWYLNVMIDSVAHVRHMDAHANVHS